MIILIVLLALLVAVGLFILVAATDEEGEP